VPILARILRDRGIITERQLEEAIQHQVLYGGRLGTSLYELGFLTEERLHEALAKAHGVATLKVDRSEINADTLSLVSKEMAARDKVFPYRVKGKTLFLLMVDPSDHATVARIGFSRGYIIKPLVISEVRMIQLLRDYYDVDDRWRFTDTHGASRRLPASISAEVASERIEAAETRDDVVETVLAACHSRFRRVIFFIVREPKVLGWSGRGEGVDPELAAGIEIPLDEPSVFQTVTRDRTVFIGRFGPEPANERFMKLIAKRPNTNAALFPISVRGRVVNLVYCDAGASGNVKADIGELMIFIQRIPEAYVRIIRRRIAETRELAAQLAEESAEGSREN
jgi:hypothetical protein